MSSTELLRAYWAQRYPALVYVPLAALIFVVGAVAVGATITPSSAAEGIGLVFALVLVFRVWDDIVDRDADRVRDPQRVVPRAESLAPLLGLIAALATACVAILALRGRVGAIVSLLAMALAFAGWYAVRSRIGAGPLTNAHVLLLKYPLIAVIASQPQAPPQTAPLLAALGALYLGLCIREMLDDSRLRADRRVHGILAVEGAILVGLLYLTLATGGLFL